MSNFRKISKRSRIHVLFSFLLSLSDFYQCRKIGIACPMDCSKPAPPRSSRISKVSVIVGQLVRRSAGLRLRARLASPRLDERKRRVVSVSWCSTPRSASTPIALFPVVLPSLVPRGLFMSRQRHSRASREDPFHHGAEKCHRTRAFKSSYTLFWLNCTRASRE